MTCEELESKTLGRALADPAIGDPKGRVFVEFATETPAGDSGYDPRSVEQRSSMPAMWYRPSEHRNGAGSLRTMIGWEEAHPMQLCPERRHGAASVDGKRREEGFAGPSGWIRDQCVRLDSPSSSPNRPI